MSLLDDPIPPRPDEFSPFGAPAGVATDFTAFKAWINGQPTSDPWYLSRPFIRPRMLLVHTNGAPREGNLASQINWANSNPNNTHPHYCLNSPQPTKCVPSNRKGIGNYKVADWSIVVETADAGWPTPGNLGGFLYDHAELVARIIAYESIVAEQLGAQMPLEYPDQWDGAGVGCHTEPFAYPYWSNAPGKQCPGTEKKRQVRTGILPRARQIRDAWLAPDPPPEVRDMPPTILRLKGYADVVLVQDCSAMPLSAELLQVARAQDTVYEVGGNALATPLPYHQQTHRWLEHELGYALTATANGN